MNQDKKRELKKIIPLSQHLNLVYALHEAHGFLVAEGAENDDLVFIRDAIENAVELIEKYLKEMEEKLNE